MVIVRKVLDDGAHVTISADVYADAAMPLSTQVYLGSNLTFATGLYLGDLEITLESGTAVGTIAGIVRQLAATVIEDAIRAAETRANLSVLDLQNG